MRALTLRLDDETHERLRRESFESRTPISDLVRTALTVNSLVDPLGCDVCGEPPTTARPNGFKFCRAHGGRDS